MLFKTIILFITMSMDKYNSHDDDGDLHTNVQHLDKYNNDDDDDDDDIQCT